MDTIETEDHPLISDLCHIAREFDPALRTHVPKLSRALPSTLFQFSINCIQIDEQCSLVLDWEVTHRTSRCIEKLFDNFKKDVKLYPLPSSKRKSLFHTDASFGVKVEGQCLREPVKVVVIISRSPGQVSYCVVSCFGTVDSKTAESTVFKILHPKEVLLAEKKDILEIINFGEPMDKRLVLQSVGRLEYSYEARTY